MIARMWSGRSTPHQVEGYLAFLRDHTLPHLAGLAGHRGASVLRRSSANDVAVTVITFWDSLDAISRFAGADPEMAVVPPEAQAMLTSWDARAVHWEVVV